MVSVCNSNMNERQSIFNTFEKYICFCLRHHKWKQHKQAVWSAKAMVPTHFMYNFWLFSTHIKLGSKIEKS